MTLNHLESDGDRRSRGDGVSREVLRDAGGWRKCGFGVYARRFRIRVIAMKAGKDTQVSYPGFFHIAFFLGSEEKVNELYAKLRTDGYDPLTPERHHGYTFYVAAPGGFTVELGA